MNRLFLLFLISGFHVCMAQEGGFKFGQTSYAELQMKTYEKDTSAAAVILKEFGHAYIENDNNYNLIFEYHAKIKILKAEGLAEANFELPLYKSDNGKAELLRSVKASAFNIENGSMAEAKMSTTKGLFYEKLNKRFDLAKFTIPNVRVGSIIEVEYILESPFIFNFRNWEFQSHIPTVETEYWATIPGVYIYNVTMKGFQKLVKEEHKIIKDCYGAASGGIAGGPVAECVRYMLAMKDVPALKKEDYMTAASNFRSAINFELSEVRRFDGSVDRVTKEWKDADQELDREPDFGGQLKRAKDVVKDSVEAIVAATSDPLVRAKRIYTYVRDWYLWNGERGLFSDGLKKAYENKKGKVADINLTLVSALRQAGFVADPVILSTRENGYPIELHPVLSDFNYVIARLALGDKVFLLDATDDFLPFGLIPDECINGKGRVMADKGSYWVDLKPADKEKRLTMLTLKLNSDGTVTGKMTINHTGYAAVRQRKRMAKFQSTTEYTAELNNTWDKVDIKKAEYKNVDDENKPLGENFDIEIKAFDNLNDNLLLFNPYIITRWDENPFKSSERLYPVDFGIPVEETIVFSLEYPQEFELSEPPAKIALSLPNGGGRYINDVQNLGNKVTLNSVISITRTVYSSQEYHYLKELFNNVMQVQQTDLVLKRK